MSLDLCVWQSIMRQQLGIAENRGVSGRTKHFSDAIHYVRHMLDHLMICIRYVSTHFQLADGFTKPLGKKDFRIWCSRLLCGVGDEFC